MDTLTGMYLRSQKAEGRSRSTLMATRQRLQTFTRAIAELDDGPAADVVQLRARHVEWVKTALSEPPYNYSANSLHNSLGAAHGFLSWCVHPQGVMETNPAAGLVPPRGKPKRRALSAEQREQLRNHSDPEHWAVYELLLNTGLRRGELRAHTLGGKVISGSDLTANSLVRGVRGWFLRVENKGKVREIPVEDRALDLLRQLISEAEAAGRRELIPVKYASLGDWWRRDRERAQKALRKNGDDEGAEAWEGLTLHALRATAITVMVNELRLPLGDVAAIVGHDDIRTTENYREPDEVMVRQRLASLSDLMFPLARAC